MEETVGLAEVFLAVGEVEVLADGERVIVFVVGVED